jgi:hypothetical protein
VRLLLDPIDDHAGTRLHTIKYTTVAVIPDGPSSKYDQRIQALVQPIICWINRNCGNSFPPILKEFARLGARCCNPTDFII